MNIFTINITFPKDAEGAPPSHIETWFVPRVGDIIEGRQFHGFRYVVSEVVIDIAEVGNGKTAASGIRVVAERPGKRAP